MSHLMPRRTAAFAFATCLAISLVPAAVFSQQAEALDPAHAAKMTAGLELFKTKVGGILAHNCVHCHGGDATEGELDLTTREKLLKGGASGDSIVIGKHQESYLYTLITHAEEPEMPMEASKLKDDEIAAIAKWIDLGAPYDKPLVEEEAEEVKWTERRIDPKRRDHWSFQPLVKAGPPKVKNEAWAKSPIDGFILAALEAKGLAPNGPTERRKLIRRAYFDLVGLPPTPAEVEAFVKDTDPQAYAKLIDRLLDSPHYGERWGRYWLDIARFGESHGFEQDYDRPNAYHYRDFVIQALNQDMPFDQFVRWQLAGDELAPDEPLAMMATGFLAAGAFPTQLTEKEFESARYDELDDMASTTGNAMLGLTVGCARCHDHKFDPIPQADYYRFVSNFTSTIRSELELNLTSERERQQLAAAHQQKVEAAKAELQKFEQQELPKQFDAFVAAYQGPASSPQPWTALTPISPEISKNARFELQPDGSLLKTGATPDLDTLVFMANTSQQGITALRLEALADKSFPLGGPGLAGNGNFCLSDVRVTAAQLKGGEPVQVKIVSARATFEQNKQGLSVASSFDGDASTTGWAVDQGGIGKDQAALFAFEKPIGFEGGTVLTVSLRFDHPNKQHAVGRPRLSITSHDASTIDLKAAAATMPEDIAGTLARLAKKEEVSPDAKMTATKWFAGTLPQWQKLSAATILPPPISQGQVTKVMLAGEGVPKLTHHANGRGFPHFYPETFFLKRGDANQKDGPADAGLLQAVLRAEQADAGAYIGKNSPWSIAPPSGSKSSFRRATLANWMTDANAGAGHLVARVAVNRLWQHHFGRGIVATVNDFGTQGEKPTHPELLDWLASDLIAGGWRLKRLHREIMLSSTYQQSAEHNDAAAKADPLNTLLWRYSPRRLEGESIRDSMLAVSGQLDRRQFGPGTLDEGMPRRSIYFFVKRSRMIPMMQLFDMPEPLVSVGERPATTIAPQALLFMNNPHVRRYAHSFAAQLAGPFAKSPADAVREGYLIAVSREPSETEQARSVAFIEQQIASYKEQKKPHPEKLALADFCQVLFSLNEFVFVE